MQIRKLAEDMKTGIPDKEGRVNQNRIQQSFGDQFNKVQSEMVQQELEGLFNDIDKQGQTLAKTLNIKDLKKYKDLIQKFLDYAVNKMYSLKEQSGWDRRGRHKIYTMVETVNKGLENLTEMLLSEQKDQLSTLAKIDEIRGILFDIYS